MLCEDSKVVHLVLFTHKLILTKFHRILLLLSPGCLTLPYCTIIEFGKSLHHFNHTINNYYGIHTIVVNCIIFPQLCNNEINFEKTSQKLKPLMGIADRERKGWVQCEGG